MDALRPRSDAVTHGNRECGGLGWAGRRTRDGARRRSIRRAQTSGADTKRPNCAHCSPVRCPIRGRQALRPPPRSFRVLKRVSGEQGSIPRLVRAAESAVSLSGAVPQESKAQSRSAVPGQGRTRQLSQEETLAKKPETTFSSTPARGRSQRQAASARILRTHNCSIGDTDPAETDIFAPAFVASVLETGRIA